MSTLVIDTIQGKTTAGSVNVRGEGSANTNLQQGLCKAWSHHSGAGSISDSFNATHTTDHGSNDNTFSFTAPMGNGTYSVTFGGGQNGARTTKQQG